MAQCIKVLAAKPDGLSSIPRTHTGADSPKLPFPKQAALTHSSYFTIPSVHSPLGVFISDTLETQLILENYLFHLTVYQKEVFPHVTASSSGLGRNRLYSVCKVKTLSEKETERKADRLVTGYRKGVN